MASNMQDNNAISLFSSAVTVDANTTAIALPQAEAYQFICDATYTSGTSATLDVNYQHSPDGGTTWYTFARHAQITTASVVRRLIIQPSMGRGEAGSEGSIGTTGALNANCPIKMDKFRISFDSGGTNPTYSSVKVWVVLVPKSQVSF
jgi:hypothetical protein